MILTDGASGLTSNSKVASPSGCKLGVTRTSFTRASNSSSIKIEETGMNINLMT